MGAMSAERDVAPGLVHGPDGQGPRSVAEDELCRCLEPHFPGIAAIRRHRSSAATSYASEVLTIELAGSKTQQAFLKDFGCSRLPKDDLPARRERELRVYRDLLDAPALGTATYYGALWNEAAGRFWLLLEFVHGEQLRSCGFDDWARAAGWLGHMQGYFAREAERLEACGFLVAHDAPFYWTKARLALEAVSQRSPCLAARVAAILDDHSRLVALLTSQPRTLVHGSYRAQNILVGTHARPPRITPVDWELAGLGAPLYDFAFLSDGFAQRELDALWDAYRRASVKWGLSPPPWKEARRVVDGLRLVKVLKSLGDSVSLDFKEATVVKLVGSAEAIKRGLDP
jgi:hypothetical protein